MLVGQYRRGEAADPDTYIAAVAAILSDYPEETIRYVTDPRTGIASNPPRDPKTGYAWKGIPDTADVKAACEAHYGPARRAAHAEREARAQVEQRQRLELADQRPRKSYDEHKADLAARGLFIGVKAPPAEGAGLAALFEKYGITQAQWDAVPSPAEHHENLKKKGLCP